MTVGTVDELRDAWLATIAAADRAGAQLHGAGPPGRRLPWQDAVTECWRALSLVYAGLAGDRHSPAGSAGELLADLRAARVDADRAAVSAARVRWRLAAAEDRLRRTRSVADVVAAGHFAGAITRLDLVSARLAVGSRRIDQSVAALISVLAAPPVRSGGTATNGDTHRADSTTSDNRIASDAGGENPESDRVRAEQIAHGCHAASALVARRHRRRRAPMMSRGRRW
ncbi:hypothetical protein [Micromonospora sp. WMMD1155]|uniref:hypothetical protein n=1 Tax=Micromonospora sp. WMMD1155 TaxID=3016094 RepID=UPI00249BB7CF|nr:hypothetical protein [Micromonospora sp. WMMD1155]WFE52716.1 hypothetical protein O7617_21430 [Micromonospora sp. WMMD1155]